MRQDLDVKCLAQGWTLSLLLHLGVVAAAVIAIPKMTVLIPQEPFRWDVAVVEPSAGPLSRALAQDSPAPSAEPPAPAAQPARAAHAKPPRPSGARPLRETDMVMARVAPQQSPQVVHPAVEPPRPQPPIAPVQAAPPIQGAIQTPVMPIEPQEAKKSEARELEPIVKQEPATEPPQEAAWKNDTFVAMAEQPIDESRPASPASPAAPPVPPAQQAPVAPASPPTVVEPKTLQETPAPAFAPSNSAVAPPQVAQAALPAQPRAPDAKADYRWLADLLWKRVVEFKRYPSSARLNGLEGKVVLKAVIRADGQLVEVTVQKSSGHAVLDAAAIETVKLATPLAMTQPLKRSEIVVSLPIVYSLAN